MWTFQTCSISRLLLSLSLSFPQVPHGARSTRPPSLWSAWWAVWSAWSVHLTFPVAWTSEWSSTYLSTSLQTVISSPAPLPVRPLNSGAPRPPVYHHNYYCTKANVTPTPALSLVKSTDVFWKHQSTIRHKCIVSSCVSNDVLYSVCLYRTLCTSQWIFKCYGLTLKTNVSFIFNTDFQTRILSIWLLLTLSF